jgi:transposase-like protein
MHNIKQGKRGGPSHYEASFKRKVVEDLLSGTITKAELRRKYQISGPSIERWLSAYQANEQQLLTLSSMNQEDKASEAKDQSPSAQIQALAEELRLAKIKLACLETLIDVAEETLHIDIRKKPGTKSPKE